MTKNARLARTILQERACLLTRYDPDNDSVQGLAALFDDIARALREADRQANALRKHADRQANALRKHTEALSDALRKHTEALSEISALCGPSSMGVSMFDIDPHPDVVVEQVRTLTATRRGKDGE